ncbi:MAG: hypothetical protein ACYS5W_10350 [Planctomycetota bacterium]|jgi:hypothetical protein
MHIPLVFHALVLSLAAGALGAQNLVTNGDFEAGTTTTGAPKGWTLSGYACTQNVNMADVTGGGASNCFNCRPGGKTTPKPYPPNIMEQDVLLIPGVVHEFRADIMAARPNSTVGNADAGTFEVFVDGVSIAKKAFGGISPPAIHRTRLCARIVPKSVGKKKLRITLTTSSWAVPRASRSASPVSAKPPGACRCPRRATPATSLRSSLASRSP